jgi:hypothetical protein
MHLIGPSNWFMPAWLDRILPNLSVDTENTEPNVPDEEALPVG